MDSQAIINTMEVLETKPVSSLVSEVTVKVCYVSDEPNRNETVISEDVGREIAATLPGAPIVGFFNEATQDFEEHSRRITIDNNGIKFEDLTKPYGFVSPMHEPWYQNFVEDGIERKYLMCKGYLWTRQYEEAKQIKKKGQSMELNEEDMSGYYDGDVFVFTHATLDKLCILGDEFEPCFEGANIVANYSLGYKTLVDEIEATIGEKYYVLNDTLVKKEMLECPESNMNSPETKFELNTENAEVTENTENAENVESVEGVENTEVTPETEPTAEFTAETAESNEAAETVEITEAVEAAEVTETTETVETPEEAPTSETADFTLQNEFEELKNKYSLLEQQLNEKNAEIEKLNASLDKYQKQEKEKLEEDKKALATSYSTLLSTEEMQPVMDNMAQYSLEEFESKLAVIYARKQQKATSGGKETYQLNIASVNETEEVEIPGFMKKAIEYDKNNF